MSGETLATEKAVREIDAKLEQFSDHATKAILALDRRDIPYLKGEITQVRTALEKLVELRKHEQDELRELRRLVDRYIANQEAPASVPSGQPKRGRRPARVNSSVEPVTTE